MFRYPCLRFLKIGWGYIYIRGFALIVIRTLCALALIHYTQDVYTTTAVLSIKR